MKSIQLIIPTPDLVIRAGIRFDIDDRYGPADRILLNIFNRYPNNISFDDVLIKVTLLNSLYTTNIFAFWAMAQHIHELNIDPALDKSNLNIIESIANLKIKEKIRRNYSFATKYCSWHKPEEYPIYDSLVGKILIIYRNEFAFEKFYNSDLQNYLKYKNIYSSFQNYFGLQQFSFKQIDKFLWFSSKDLKVV
ncbi:MAG: hypothetical protein JW908_17035 [Anaerolineales bacterium]|nr:hypothetical protein [Anaerolineales bacterium]